MRPRDRRLKITDIVRQQGRVSVAMLVTEFNSSPETIRRDLKKLSRSGIIQKIHGGAILPGIQGEGPFQQRMGEHVAAKRQIAKKASQLISPGDTVMIDTGSTTLIFAEEISQLKNLTVVTNSVEVAKVVARANNGSSVYLLGGKYHSDNRETMGAMVMSQLAHFHAQHVVLTIGAISATAGVMAYDMGEVEIGSAMLARASNAIMLADSTKFNRVAPFVIGALDKFNQLVCEFAPDEILQAALFQDNVEIVC